VDPSSFERVEVFRDSCRVRIGFLGRLDPVKNIDFWVQAVWFAGRDDRNVEGHIFGEGPERERIERAIAAFEVQDRVFLRGGVRDPREALRQMDVLFLSSGGEGFGLVLIEAMASGVPVIALRSGGVTDIIRDGENGLLIESQMFCYRRLGVLLDRLVDDAALRQALIENGLRTVRDQFSWDVVLPRYRELLGI
jgi:glycosyltransferase involved in cell wall biosynthesis